MRIRAEGSTYGFDCRSIQSRRRSSGTGGRPEKTVLHGIHGGLPGFVWSKWWERVVRKKVPFGGAV